MNLYPPGYRIAGQYEVAGRPLMGGMGIVYLCFDHGEQRPVALKTFKPEYLPDRAARARFLREGDTWIKLGRHPHVVRAYSVQRISDGTEVYLVLELIAKEQGREDASLRSWLSPGKPLPTDQTLVFAMQVVRAMQHATATIAGFVHRDLKPENVLVGSDKLTNANINRLRVTDFGLSRIVEETMTQASPSGELSDPSHIQFTRGAGTPLYMAPEQWRGERLGVQADIYALGCIVFEMLAGARMVDGNTLKTLEAAHCSGKHKPLPTALPASLRTWVAQCVAVEPGARYASWGAVEAELREAYREVTGQALPAAEPQEAVGHAERVAAGWSSSEMGYSYLDLGRAEVAVGYFERAVAVGKAEGERSLESAGLMHLGIAYKDLGEARRAIGCYERALVILRDIGDRRGEGAALGNLGLAYARLGDARHAIGCYEQALVILREISERRGEGSTLNNLGEAYRILGDVRRAIGYYEQALAIDREIGDRRAEGNALGNLGNAYADLGEARRAIGCYEQLLVIAREIGDRRGEGTALGNLGIAYKDLGDARRAIRYYEQYLAIAREIGDRRGEGAALNNLGLTYADLGDARRAVGRYEQALAIEREIGDRRGEGKALGNLGSVYYRLGDARRAIDFYKQAIAIRREIGEISGEAAEQLIAALQGGAPAQNAPNTEQIRQQFASLVAAIVAAARGNANAKQQVEQVFDVLTQNGWQIVEPIQRIWKGERDEAKLVAGFDANSAFIVREILRQLK